MIVPSALPRLVVSDLDGTLLRSDHTVSDRTRAALRLVIERGSTVLFATGRPPRWIPPVVEQTGVSGLAICSNGALLYDMATERAVRERLLEPALGREVIAELGAALPEAVFAVELGDRFRWERGYPVPPERSVPVVRAEVQRADLCAMPALKVLMWAPDCDPDVLLDKARALIGTRAEATRSGDEPLIEIAAHGVTKAAMLGEYCADRGIASNEVIAFGDMPNDLEMLGWVGTGYAMAGGAPELRQVTGLVCPSNNDDGVAVILEQVFG